MESNASLTSPMFIAPKSRGGWRPIRDLRYLNSYLEPPHFKMEDLYMLPTILKSRLHHRHHNNDHLPPTSQDGSHTEGSFTSSRIWVNPNPSMFYWHIDSHQASNFSGSPSFLGLARPKGSGPPALSDVRPGLDTTVSGSQDQFTVVENSVIYTPFYTNLEA